MSMRIYDVASKHKARNMIADTGRPAGINEDVNGERGIGFRRFDGDYRTGGAMLALGSAGREQRACDALGWTQIH
jgi:hypothetical protein